jgi:tyrosine-protein kinase Etk/Wzc
MLFLFKTLVGWRKFILVWGLVGALVMVVVSLLLPKWYTASTTIFPPEVSPAASMYAQVFQNVSAPLLGQLGSGTAPETVYIDMLKSRAIREKVIKEFDLMKVYHASVIEQALKTFHNRCGFTLLVNGLIVVTFEDRDPQRAAAIANRMIELLDEFSRNMKTTRAGRTREFIEGQLDTHQKELAAAEAKLRDFQSANDALELDEQLQAAMNIISTLTARAISLETEMEIMGHYASSSSEEYKRKQREYDEVLAQLKKLKKSSGESDRDLVRSFLPALGDVPELALEMIRLKRNVEIQSTVYSMLVKEYEKARIEEARDTPTVQILDRAEVPNLRSRPRRKMLVILGGVVGAGWAAIIALFTTAWRENRESAAAWRDVFSPLVGDFSRLIHRRKPPAS